MFGRKSTKETASPVRLPEPSTEQAYREAWGITRERWEALAWQDRADYRDRVAYATPERGNN